ncbi:MAG: hypothetical protein M3Q48_09555 [Actinomycetota bacterium]|nr:hypothetical protein [Actinomycetota bacterium]
MSRRLTPVAVAERLFAIPPDRDERASQLCSETLLTLAENGYAAPAGDPRSPKRQRFAVRSLALSLNFLEDRAAGRAGRSDLTPQAYGALLARGDEVRDSANLRLAKQAMEGLVDPSTQAGQRGTWLLLPFHEALLWYDARRQQGRGWGVRKVYMRGSGITLARLLLDPPSSSARAAGLVAVSMLRDALRQASPLATVADHLESALDDAEDPEVQDDEKAAWAAGGAARLAPLAERVCRHAEGIMAQAAASGPARVWQLRTMLALDLALHALGAARDATDVPVRARHLLLVFGGPARAENRVRQRSEGSYRTARILIREATVRALSDAMQEITAGGGPEGGWLGEFEVRRQPKPEISAVVRELSAAGARDFERLAREAFHGANYDRSGDGFRVLLESVGMLTGTGAYRYLTATPDLLGAMTGALSARMPMPSDEFWQAVFDEWGLLVGPDQLASTSLAGQLDGADLARNARRAEAVLADAGMAVALSDRTTLVGERAVRRR